MSRRVYLHVGAPKTGTTYVQDRLALNADALRRHRYAYPVGEHPDMFLAALDVVQRPWGGLRPQAEGEWAALVERTRRARGTVVLSHEILAGASPTEARNALADLSFAEVHVVYSARDLARQVAAEWQEQLKHRRKVSFATFLKQVRESDPRRSHRWFWRVQGLPGVLERWGHGLPPERVHLVTVPQPGAPYGELWRRFCTAVGMEPEWAPLDSERRNPSIGVAESTLIRKLNARLKKAGMASEDYRQLVRQLVVHETLAHRPRMRPVTLPPEAFDWAEEVTEGWEDWVRASGIDVVGDLEDLRPVRPAPGTRWHDPDDPRPRDVASAALDALEALALEAARRAEPAEPPLTRAARLARLLKR